MSVKTILPAWDDIEGLEGNEVFFESKQNNRGAFLYRKIITNNRHTVVIDGGEPINGLKPSGKWLHEDDFGTNWVCNPKRTQNIAIVELDGALISRVIDVYDRNINQWRSAIGRISSILMKKTNE
jgi:hypothetical protein